MQIFCSSRPFLALFCVFGRTHELLQNARCAHGRCRKCCLRRLVGSISHLHVSGLVDFFILFNSSHCQRRYEYTKINVRMCKVRPYRDIFLSIQIPVFEQKQLLALLSARNTYLSTNLHNRYCRSSFFYTQQLLISGF